MSEQKWAGHGSENTTAPPENRTYGMAFGGGLPNPAGSPPPAPRPGGSRIADTSPPLDPATHLIPEKSPPRPVPPPVDYQKRGSLAYAAEYKKSNPKERRNRILMLAGIGAAAVVLLLCVVLIVVLVRPGSKTVSGGTNEGGGSRASDSKEWSGWLQELPKDVTEADYDVEERILYSTRTLETTSSTTDKSLKGWELYKTAEGNRDWGAWSDWSATPATQSPSREVQTQTRYRYRDKETTKGSARTMSGWTLEDTTYTYGDYGKWSDWSSSKPTKSETREVQEKSMYRYRDKQTSTATSMTGVDPGWEIDWEEDYCEAWSEWSESTFLGMTQGKEFESQDVEVGRRYLMGHYCTGDVAGAQWQTASTNYTTNDVFNANCIYHELGWYDDLSAFNPGNGGYIGTTCSNSCWTWYIMDEDPICKTEYRWRYHYTIYHTYRWGNWSEWRDTPPNSLNTNREVQINTLYRCRDRSKTPVYHFSRWTDWSDWMTSEYRPSDTRKVESATFYSYRDRVTETTYFFRRWTDWSEYSEKPSEPSDTVEVRTVTQYRYKKK